MSVVVAVRDEDSSWVLGRESQTTDKWLKLNRRVICLFVKIVVS